MKFGSRRDQLYLIYENLAHRYGFHYKAKKSHQKCSQNPNVTLMWAITTDQIRYFIIMPQHAKFSNQEITVSLPHLKMTLLQRELRSLPIHRLKGRTEEARGYLRT